MPIYFVTSNDHKVREAEGILGLKIEKVSLDLLEIQSLDSAAIVEDKARRAFAAVKQPVFVEDTGLHLDALSGFPGALAKWVDKSAGFGWLCQSIGPDRRAYAKTCIGFYDGTRLEVFTGRIRGRISSEVRGDNGFGWDKIFIPENFTRTFAEMSLAEKNAISHRMQAFQKLKEFLSLHSVN